MDKVFKGNPAEVCSLTEWLDDRVELAGHAMLYMKGEKTVLLYVYG